MNHTDNAVANLAIDFYFELHAKLEGAIVLSDILTNL